MTVVNHGAVLRGLRPMLGGTISGQRQVQRIGSVIAIASLEPSRFSDEWEGVRIRIVCRTGGELDSNVFLFSEHGVLPAGGNGRITASNAADVEGLDPLRTVRLARAVAEYVGAFQ
ncbi:hypothetical protein ACIQI7_09220 [Kitasatospora sp. NPDC092039]|uniref:hypothetical protein n=1 Tax=Kitasatospora sp. NPDC092039 TaxID=3364086 RepID=UPI003827EEF7